MYFKLFTLSALLAAASALPTELNADMDTKATLINSAALVARGEYRWCYGKKINLGTMRKFEYRMRDIDHDTVCNQWAGVDFAMKECLMWTAPWCVPSAGGVTCDPNDETALVHGGFNVALTCTGAQVKHCIDRTLGIEGNTNYVCNHD